MRNKKYIVGNWKMNGLSDDLLQIGEIDSFCGRSDKAEVAICPPATLINGADSVASQMQIGAQDVHYAETGAHTGCLSAAMLKQAGASFSIIGHSERRTDQFETDELVAAKANALKSLNMSAILCVGEPLNVRDEGNAIEFVREQMLASWPDDAHSDWLTIAYEPIWAIGTGRVPDNDDISAMHDALRDTIKNKMGSDGDKVRILYGGSVNGSNAKEIMNIDNVDGALVGGASLTAAKFVPIIEAVG